MLDTLLEEDAISDLRDELGTDQTSLERYKDNNREIKAASLVASFMMST